MMRYILLACFAAVFSLSCDKTYKSEGLITGFDGRYCLCHCGGMFIAIDGQTYRIYPEQLPKNSLNLDQADFPVKVKLDWKPSVEDCGATDVIDVTRIKKR